VIRTRRIAPIVVHRLARRILFGLLFGLHCGNLHLHRFGIALLPLHGLVQVFGFRGHILS
jgi:hypothetical protein